MRRAFVALVVVGVVAGFASSSVASEPGWTIAPSPNPAGATINQFFGVWCTTRVACTAVGAATFPAAGGVQNSTLAERWDGKSWTIQPTQNPGTGDNVLRAVSCPEITVCFAVGAYFNAAEAAVPLIEQWNGTTWSTDPTSSVVGGLSGVSCASATACTAVGGSGSTGVDQTLAERWNGTSWQIQSTPNEAGARGDGLSGVSCPTTRVCIAVGQYSYSSGPVQTLVERWNGTTWRIQSAPTGGSALSEVSCPTAKFCMAFGGLGVKPNSGTAPVGPYRAPSSLRARRETSCSGCRVRRRPPAPQSGITRTAPVRT